jgi:arylsulfatase A-like enzyme
MPAAHDVTGEPFPPTPSASIAGRTMQESVYKQRVEPRRLPADAPNINRLADDGINFMRRYIEAACTPTGSRT